MSNANELSDTEQWSLDHKIILIEGDISKRTADYVHVCLQQLTIKGSPPIEVHIRSMGGAVEAAFDIHDNLRLYKGKKRGIVIGYAKSMAIDFAYPITIPRFFP